MDVPSVFTRGWEAKLGVGWKSRSLIFPRGGHQERSQCTETERVEKRLMECAHSQDGLLPDPGRSLVPLSYGNEVGARGRGAVPAGSLRLSVALSLSLALSPLFPLPAALPLRSQLPPPALPESIPALGRGERFSAEQTKPAAAMRGEHGSARWGGRDGVPVWRVGPLGKRRGPLIPKRQAIPPRPLPLPQSRRSERHRLGGELVNILLISRGELGGLWRDEVRRMKGWRERREVGGKSEEASKS